MHHKKLFVFTFFSLVFFAAFGQTCDPNRDSLILLEFYTATHENGHWDNEWDINKSMDTWFGVTLNEKGCVECIDMDGPSGAFKCSLQGWSNVGNNLAGSLPKALGDLQHLKFILFSGNMLYGEIPSELGRLTKLEALHLGKNQLSDNIPETLGNLENLVQLYLDRNQLTSHVPPELGGLSKLEKLYLDQNQLNGNIPAELGDLGSLEELRLNNNQLMGCFPEELAVHCAINIDFSNNPLLPWQGDFERFCNGEEQPETACDENPLPDEIDEMMETGTSSKNFGQQNITITPNKDGKNDFLKFEELDQYPENEIFIVNRWGAKVFEAKPYQNDWNGVNMNGGDLPDGTYYYIINLDIGESKLKYGFVAIKR